jgi:hypothetical protein
VESELAFGTVEGGLAKAFRSRSFQDLPHGKRARREEGGQPFLAVILLHGFGTASSAFEIVGTEGAGAAPLKAAFGMAEHLANPPGGTIAFGMGNDAAAFRVVGVLVHN